MSGLYFLGIKKSTIKKTPPFKYLFDWRDKRIHQHILQSLNGNIETISETDSLVHYSLNGRELKLIVRNFPCSDLAVVQQLFVEGCYEPIIKKMLEYFSAESSPKIVDAGANVGYSVIYFKTFFPSSEIIAIEPEEKNQQQLLKNILTNNFELKGLVKGALWYCNAHLEVVRDFRDNRDAAFTVRETKNETGIEGFGFTEILQRNNWTEADLVKIDIEGGERFLFQDATKADEILSRTKFLAIEIHDEFNIRQTIYDHLDRNGFEYFHSGDLTLAINKQKLP